MKLAQATLLRENSPGVASLLQKHPEIKVNKVNADGSIDISAADHLEFLEWDSSWPKLNHVNAGEVAFHLNSVQELQYLPITVTQSCSLYLTFDSPIKSSMFPKCTGAGWASVNLNYADSQIILDDDTLSSYFRWAKTIMVVDGYNFVPTTRVAPWGGVKVHIQDWAKWPSGQEFDGLEFIIDSPEVLNKIHTKAKIQAKTCQFTIPDPSPLLGLLTAVSESSTISFIIKDEPQNEAGVDLTRIFRQRDSMDVFELQEALIDAGYGRFAKR